MSQGYIENLPHVQSKMGQWEGFVFDDNVWLVADWRQGMLTIGSTPDPGALHLTQGVVRVVGVGCVSVIFSTIYIRILTFVSLCLS